MILTHVFLRGPCRWVWQWLSAAKWSALPRVTALALACGGPTTRLPAEPVPVPQRHTERGTEAVWLPTVWGSESPIHIVEEQSPYAPPSILVFLPPAPVDLRPAMAPALESTPGVQSFVPARYEVEDHQGREHGRSDTPRSDVPGNDVPEPASIAVLAVALGMMSIGKWRRNNE